LKDALEQAKQLKASADFRLDIIRDNSDPEFQWLRARYVVAFDNFRLVWAIMAAAYGVLGALGLAIASASLSSRGYLAAFVSSIAGGAAALMLGLLALGYLGAALDAHVIYKVGFATLSLVAGALASELMPRVLAIVTHPDYKPPPRDPPVKRTG
jgi:hypothetical protein